SRCQQRAPRHRGAIAAGGLQGGGRSGSVHWRVLSISGMRALDGPHHPAVIGIFCLYDDNLARGIPVTHWRTHA
ncbi:hypothetical protein, partial [Acidovorax delafieldii]|uniref:hypothetical protein n=1 Tax=Acidovorax delafieldii TaxID=47920 RepID=UPI001E420939